MPTILIGGYYGAGNIGDEAILAAMVGELRSRRSDLSFVVTSWGPEKTSRDLHVDAIQYNDINALLDAALKADLIILGGGGIFHDYWGLDPDTYLRSRYWDISFFGSMPLLAKLLDIPCMIYAVGVGPFQTDLARQHTRLAFERCQIATLRDSESLEFLEQTGFDVNNPGGPVVKVLPDPVFALTTSAADDEEVAEFLSQRQVERGTPLLGISLRYWDLERPLEEWLPFIANGVREFLNKANQVQVILIPFQVTHSTAHTNDAAVLKKLADLLDMPARVHWIEKPLTPRFAQALIKRCTVIVGMRLHSVIMAINVGTPVVALSYAPKVRSVMKRAGLDEFCNESLTPEASALATQIQAAWDQSREFHLKVQPLQEELKAHTLEHARLALELLSGSQRKPLQFSQQFALQQVRLLLHADGKLALLQQETQTLQMRFDQEIQTLRVQLQEQQALRARLELEMQSHRTRLAELEMLSDRMRIIESSRFWKLANRYYRLRDETAVKYLYRFLVTWKHEGLGRALDKSFQKLTSGLWPARAVATDGGQSGSNLKTIETGAQDSKTGAGAVRDSSEVVKKVVDRLNGRTFHGVVLVTSTIVFDELYNQRDINLSKFLARQGWGVVFVASRWKEEEAMPSIGEEVYPNLFQIPKDMLLAHPDILARVQCPQKYFVIEFPHPDFLSCMLKLRRGGYRIVYEIIDEWEELHKVGQASWFNKSIEEAFVINANFLTAVSRPLIDKFARLRRDIHLSPNGYTPSLLGERYRNIASKKQVQEDEMHLGFCGNLADAWFDWDFLLKVVDLAWEKNLKLFVHLIGYGEPDLQAKISGYANRVKFYGKIPPPELYKYVSTWDASLICFKPGKLSEAVDPTKIYEYLYFGLPVIVKGIHHLKDFPSTWAVENEEQALEILIQLHQNRQKHIRPDRATLAATQKVLAGSTWERRFSDLIKILENEKWMFL